MRIMMLAAAAAALAAAPAWTQGYGTFSPAGHPPPGAHKPPSLADAYGALRPAAPAPRTPQAPKSSGSDPAQPRTYAPKPPKSCEGSVFVDACKPRH